MKSAHAGWMLAVAAAAGCGEEFHEFTPNGHANFGPQTFLTFNR